MLPLKLNPMYFFQIRFYIIAIAAAFCIGDAVASSSKCELPCVKVIDHSWGPWTWDEKSWPALISGGSDITIELSSPDFKKVEAKFARYPVKNDEKELRIDGPGLYVGGVPLGSDAKLIRRADNGSIVMLRYRIAPSNYSRQFWTTIYRDNRLLGVEKLSVALGWGAETDIPLGRDVNVRLSTLPALTGATALIAFLSVFYIWGLLRTDVFRIGSIDNFWKQARSLRRQLRWRGWLLAQKQPSAIKNKKIEMANRLLTLTNGPALPIEYSVPEYISAAGAALAGTLPTSKEDVHKALIGLSLFEKNWHIKRKPYSLSRVQIGTWTIFACSVAMFLWVVYGTFPNLEKTMFGLLGISTATSMLSYYFEDKMLINSVGTSEGFIKDILTGWDGNQYVHRFQAVIVNLLLLADGTVYVVQNLGYPIFDVTWLQFLGLSGIAQVAGKSLVENNVDGKTLVQPKLNSNSGGIFKLGKTVE